jgi:predicted phage terminase large subunit-like protein
LYQSKKVSVIVNSLDELINTSIEPRFDGESTFIERIRELEILGRFDGLKRDVVSGLMEGENLHQISKKLKVPNSRVYTIKNELMQDLQFLYEDAKRQNFIQENSDEINELIRNVKHACKQLSLSEFQEIYINDYDAEAQAKGWKNVPLQDTYEQIWENHQKSVTQAPREHLKTTSVIAYLTKKLFERDFPLEIVYFHLDKDIAVEKIRKMQLIIEKNPVLAAGMRIDQAKNWKDGEIRLLDGTVIKAMGWMQGTVGKHPHIIVMDDVIDIKVVYSEKRNERAISKFYSEVYPMISKMTDEKKIIVIGTAQKEDDLYAKLPTDFHRTTLAAHDDNNVPLEPVLFSFEDLMKIKADISFQFGEKYWLKEYMNVPFSALGLIIKPAWIKTYTQISAEGFRVSVAEFKSMQIFQGWDLAPGKKAEEEKGDWVAGATIGVISVEQMIRIYLLAMYRERVTFPERLKAIVAAANTWHPLKIGVEDNVFQYDSVITLQKSTNLPIIGVTSVTNKIESFNVELAPHFENGKVYLKADMDTVKQELLALPMGKHDDQADAIKIAIKVSAIETPEPRMRMI